MVNVAPVSDKIKACLFNLIVFCDEGSRLGYFHSFIQAVIERFPCRIIFIHSDPNDSSEAIKSKHSVVSAEEGEHVTECDMFDIYASAKQVQRVPFLIIPQLVSDLPIFMLWGTDLVDENNILSDLDKYADRVIVDSESTDNLQIFSQKILEAQKNTRLEVIDLNWARMSGWRDVIGKVFNNQERFHTLETSDRIEIVYNGIENSFFHHSETQAIYLQSWLATKLGWKFDQLKRKEGISEVTYKKDQRSIEVSLKPGTFQERAPGSIFSLYLRSPEGYEYSINRKQGSHLVVVQHSSQEVCQLPFSLYLRGTSHNFSLFREIFYSDTHREYEEILKTLSLQGWNG